MRPAWWHCGFLRGRSLRRQAVARDRRHDFAETIQLPNRRVKIWCDADANEFFMNNWRSEDVMLAEKITADLSLIQSFDLDVRDGAHLGRIERSVEANLGNVFQFVHPIS